jgi:hypothetical protein
MIQHDAKTVSRGAIIAIEYDHWPVFRRMTPSELVRLFKKLAGKVKLSAFKKHPRSPKKPQPKRISQKSKPHISTAKILEIRERIKSTPVKGMP